MEIVYLIVAVGAVFLCVFCYERGIKAGKALREVRTTERITEGGKIVTQEIMAAPEAAGERTQEEKDFDKAYRNWQGYEAKFPGVKE